MELHNLCLCLANGHFQFQLEACTEIKWERTRRAVSSLRGEAKCEIKTDL